MEDAFDAFVDTIGETLLPLVKCGVCCCGDGCILRARAGAIANGTFEDGGFAAIGICPLDGLKPELFDDAFDFG